MMSAEIIIFPMSEVDYRRLYPQKPMVITFPPELLPPNDEGTDVAVVVYPEVPFQ